MSTQKPSSDKAKNNTFTQVDKKRLTRKRPQNKSSALPVFLCFILVLGGAAVFFLDDIKVIIEEENMSQKLTVVEVIPQKEPKLPKVKEQEKKEPV